MLDQCNDCSPSCLGQDYSTDCGYIGVDIPSKGISRGDNLTGVLEKLAEESSVSSEVNNITTDDVITTSLVRNPSAVCASKIINRDFKYKLTTNISTTSFSWDMLPITSNLPSAYVVGTMQVKAVGKNNGTGTSVFTSTKLSAAQSIDINRYPVTVDLNLRIVADCGNIDLTKRIYLASPTNVEAKLVPMDVNGLLAGSQDLLTLTQQLDVLEANVQMVTQKVNEVDKVEMSGVTKDVEVVLSEHEASIVTLQAVVEDPSGFSITYEKNGLVVTENISDILEDIYNRLDDIDATLAQHTADITTLKAQVNSLL